MGRGSTQWHRAFAVVFGLLITLPATTAMDTSIASADPYMVPAEIPSTELCSADQPDATDSIQSWLNSLPNGSTAQFAANRCYRAEGTIVLLDRSNLTIEGQGSTLKAYTDGSLTDPWNPNDAQQVAGWPEERARILVWLSDHIAIRNLRVKGYHPNPGACATCYVQEFEEQHAFRLHKSDFITLDSVIGNTVYGDFVYVFKSNDVNVLNSTFGAGVGGGNGRQGLTILAGSRITFYRNDMRNVARSMIDVEQVSAGDVIRDVTIEDNVFGPGQLNFFANLGEPGVIENVTVQNNVLDGKTFNVYIDVAPHPGDPIPDPNIAAEFKRKNYRFINNTSNLAFGSPLGDHVYVRGVDTFLLSGNSVVSNPYPYQMKFAEAQASRSVSLIDNSNLNANETASYYDTVGGCERGNRLGNPLVADPTPGAPLCP